MNRLVFRFDVDTHKCIRDGVPNLLEISDEMDVPFTFFLNAGRAVSVPDSIRDMFNTHHKADGEKIEMMAAREKLGIKDYLLAAAVNPAVCTYTDQVRRLSMSRCEVGVHGGRNHALWQKYGKKWNREKVEDEIKWAVNEIKKINPRFCPSGFASPGWESPRNLDEILSKMGFGYYADLRDRGGAELVNTHSVIPQIGVNLLGEPGGVAFFEHCRVKGMSTDQIVDAVLECIDKNGMAVLYDHPYYAGVKELYTIRRMITEAREKGIKIVML